MKLYPDDGEQLGPQFADTLVWLLALEMRGDDLDGCLFLLDVVVLAQWVTENCAVALRLCPREAQVTVAVALLPLASSCQGQLTL